MACAQTSAAKEDAVTAIQKEINGIIVENSKVTEFSHTEWKDRNPFEAPVNNAPKDASAPVVLSDITLRGVFLGGVKSSAIINNAVLGIGDTIGEYTVKVIQKGSVVVVDDKGKETVLTLVVDLSSHEDPSVKDKEPAKQSAKEPVKEAVKDPAKGAVKATTQEKNPN